MLPPEKLIMKQRIMQNYGRGRPFRLLFSGSFGCSIEKSGDMLYNQNIKL